MRTAFRIPKYKSAHAILMLKDKYILQLRDNKPNICSAGQWSLFGGEIQNNQSPLQTIKREIFEELLIKPKKFKFLWYIDFYSLYLKSKVRIWFFVSDVTNFWSQHELREGQMAKSFGFKQLSQLNMPEVMHEALERFHQQGIKKLKV
jgi:8-oxo-dGTP pyrophosphatase MutT (NUDIX family)